MMAVTSMTCLARSTLTEWMRTEQCGFVDIWFHFGLSFCSIFRHHLWLHVPTIALPLLVQSTLSFFCSHIALQIHPFLTVSSGAKAKEIEYNPKKLTATHPKKLWKTIRLSVIRRFLKGIMGIHDNLWEFK
jgi:hypothetical protein